MGVFFVIRKGFGYCWDPDNERRGRKRAEKTRKWNERLGKLWVLN